MCENELEEGLPTLSQLAKGRHAVHRVPTTFW